MSDLETALGRLVDRGVLSSEQADAVRTELGAPPEALRPARPWAEALGYLGGALAAVSALVLASAFWELMSPWAQAGLLALATAVLVAGGWWVVGNEAPAARRLVSVLWLLATATGAGTVWLLAERALELPSEWVAQLVALTLLVGGAALWWRQRSLLQQIPVLAGLLATAVAALQHFPNPPNDLAPLMAWSLGVAWVLLAIVAVVQPLRTGVVLGAIVALGGAQMLAWNVPALGLGLALATTVAGFAVAAAIRQPLLAGVAVAGMVVFVPQVVVEWFEASLAVPLALFVTGVILLAGSLATFRLATRQAS